LKSSLKKILIYLILLVFIPLSVYTFIQFQSLNESEKVIKGIFENQLESVLNSAGQYSTDILTTWQSRILTVDLTNENKTDAFTQLFSGNRSLRTIAVMDTGYSRIKILFGEADSSILNNAAGILTKEKLTRLKTYRRGGYNKIEPLGIIQGKTILTFLHPQKEYLFFMILPVEDFIRNSLSPKLQEIAGDKLSIGIENEEGSIIYSNVELKPGDVEIRKEIWSLPGYSSVIAFNDATIESLVKARSYINLLLIGVINVFMILAAIFLFRNIKREVETAQLKADFVSNVSHELRTPLALISMFSETLELGRVRTDEKKQEYYGIISREAGRLSRIVNKILSFSKMEAGKRIFQFARFDINEVITEVMNTYSYHLTSNGFDYSVDLHTTHNLIMNGDKEAFTEAFINILDNAMKYCRSVKSIKVSTGFRDEYVFAEIADSGIGLSDADIQKIFDKFFRVESALVHNTKGTGLGLSLVKYIMDAHKGKVEVISKPGTGSTFRLLFPSAERKTNLGDNYGKDSDR